MALTTPQEILTLLVSQIQIGLVILMITSLLLILYSVLVLVLSHGLARSSMLMHYHLLRQNTGQLYWLVRRFCGFDG